MSPRVIGVREKVEFYVSDQGYGYARFQEDYAARPNSFSPYLDVYLVGLMAALGDDDGQVELVVQGRSYPPIPMATLRGGIHRITPLILKTEDRMFQFSVVVPENTRLTGMFMGSRDIQ